MAGFKLGGLEFFGAKSKEEATAVAELSTINFAEIQQMNISTVEEGGNDSYTLIKAKYQTAAGEWESVELARIVRIGTEHYQTTHDKVNMQQEAIKAYVEALPSDQQEKITLNFYPAEDLA